MKYALFFFSTFLCLVSCKQDVEVCDGNPDITGRVYGVDMTPLQNFPWILDTLAKYPNLRVREIREDQHGIIVHCDVYRKARLVFFGDYTLSQGKLFEQIKYVSGSDCSDFIANSDVPTLPAEKAILIAKNEMDVYGCPVYQLGYYYHESEDDSIKLRLSWRVKSDDGTPEVIIDANTGAVYYRDNGIIIN